MIGYYTLDLTDANKGKVLEPVRVTLSADKKTVIVDQYTRKLPPSRIPVAGGTVDLTSASARPPNAGHTRPRNEPLANDSSTGQRRCQGILAVNPGACGAKITFIGSVWV